jgi:hypothetical protein
VSVRHSVYDKCKQNTFVLRRRSRKVYYLCGYVRGFESKTILFPMLFLVRKSCATSQAFSHRSFTAQARVRSCGICGGHTCTRALWVQSMPKSNSPFHYHSTNVAYSHFIQPPAVSLNHIHPALQKKQTLRQWQQWVCLQFGIGSSQ